MLFITNSTPKSISNVIYLKIWRTKTYLNSANVTKKSVRSYEDEEEFRVLDLLNKKTKIVKRPPPKYNLQPDRAERMPTDQKWGNVWPGPRSFHPATVPLPVRQGYVPKGHTPPGKKANAELMKIPNFLHLTPPVVKAQCEALKKFCTKWPELLNSEGAIEKHYPLEIITSDYCHASPSIRNPLARIVTLRIKLSSLNLDKHARDKFLRLVGERYEEKTDLVTITADRCPVRKQNQEYVQYLLTACCHEACNYEEWEKEKTEDDMEYYDWDNNASKKSLINWFHKSNNKSVVLSADEYKNFDISQIPNADNYKNAVSSLFNNGESKNTIEKYGDAVRKLLGLPEQKVVN